MSSPPSARPSGELTHSPSHFDLHRTPQLPNPRNHPPPFSNPQKHNCRKGGQGEQGPGVLLMLSVPGVRPARAGRVLPLSVLTLLLLPGASACWDPHPSGGLLERASLSSAPCHLLLSARQAGSETNARLGVNLYPLP
uniref:Uncharacterized protein n=1 Tax=Knipowitschia caucasica TaxID=637954 RepID=A0AAV2K3R1_KNICA